jgi:hypothetical protein
LASSEDGAESLRLTETAYHAFSDIVGDPGVILARHS